MVKYRMAGSVCVCVCDRNGEREVVVKGSEKVGEEGHGLRVRRPSKVMLY